MRKLFTILIALAVTVGAAASSFGQGFNGGCFNCGPQGHSRGAWTPASLGSALVAWYKADVGAINTGTGVQATNGQAVNTWQDQSGNGNSLTTRGTAAPIFHSAGLGGKESTTWTVNSTALWTAATDTFAGFGTGNTASVFVLGSLTTSASSESLSFAAASQTAGAGANSAMFFFTSSTPDFTFDHAFGTGTAQSVTASTETRMGMIFDGANATPYKNNVAGTANSLSFSFASPGTLRVGGIGSGGWDGEMREVIITNTALNSTDRASLDAYLVSRQ
jgi:hypothetical protein